MKEHWCVVGELDWHIARFSLCLQFATLNVPIGEDFASRLKEREEVSAELVMLQLTAHYTLKTPFILVTS